MKELKPCPFCGSKKIIITDDCENSPYSNVCCCCDFNQGGCGAASGYRSTATEAIEAWNRRAGEQE